MNKPQKQARPQQTRSHLGGAMRAWSSLLTAAYLHELFVSLRRVLVAVVKKHLMEQLDIVVNFLQRVQALGHLLDSSLILPQPRGCRKKQVYLACLSTTRQGSFITQQNKGRGQVSELCLACFLRLQASDLPWALLLVRPPLHHSHPPLLYCFLP